MALHLNEAVSRILLSTDFMHACGRRDHALDWCHHRYQFIHTFKEAEKKMLSNRWADIMLEKSNEFSAQFDIHDPRTRNKWNDLVYETKEQIIPKLNPVLEGKLAQMGFQNQERAMSMLDYALVTISASLAYRDFYTTLFFEDLLTIYHTGHLPCNWRERDGIGYFEVY